MKAIRFRVDGRVQGVGFRWWVRNLASGFNLVGHVRNCDDGAVEIIAAGPPAALERLRSALRDGPPAADVRTVNEEEIESPETSTFEIAR